MFFNFDIKTYAIFGEGRRLAAPQIRKYSRMEPERCHSHRSWCGLVIPVCRGSVHLAAQLQQRGLALLHTGGEVVAHLHLKEFGQRPIQRTPVIHIHGHDAGHKARVGGRPRGWTVLVPRQLGANVDCQKQVKVKSVICDVAGTGHGCTLKF